MRFGAAKIDEARKVVYVQEILDATRFVGVWMGQTYECRAIPDTSGLTAGTRVFCHVLSGNSELVAIGPSGSLGPVIIYWSGTDVDIPAGWHLCDGGAGTPDARANFVMGASYGPDWDDYWPEDWDGMDQTGGHKHSDGTLGIPGGGEHKHDMDAGATDYGTGNYNTTGALAGMAMHQHATDACQNSDSGSHPHNRKDPFATNFGGLIDNRPRYYALALIMNVGGASTIPIGGIVIWSGSLATIPAGYHLCDGNAGTPNLVDRFIQCPDTDWWWAGWGGPTAYHESGGADSVDFAHNHTISNVDVWALAHTHTWPLAVHDNGAAVIGLNSSAAVLPAATPALHGHTLTVTSDAEINIHAHGKNHTGATENTGEIIDTRPPYYALAYMMRIS